MENETVKKKVKHKYDFVNKQKSYYQANKRKYKKDRESIIEIFQKKKKIK